MTRRAKKRERKSESDAKAKRQLAKQSEVTFES